MKAKVITQHDVIKHLRRQGIGPNKLSRMTGLNGEVQMLYDGALTLEDLEPAVAAQIARLAFRHNLYAKIMVACPQCGRERPISITTARSEKAWLTPCRRCQIAGYNHKFNAPCGRTITATAAAEPAFVEDGIEYYRPRECIECDKYEACLDYAARHIWPGWRFKDEKHRNTAAHRKARGTNKKAACDNP